MTECPLISGRSSGSM